MGGDNFRQGLEDLEAGRLKAAEAAFQRYLQEHPEDALGHNKLGVVYGKLQDAARARTCFWRAIELDENCIHAWNNLGNTARQEGDLEQALRCYRRAVEIDPEHPLPAKNLRTVEKQLKWSLRSLIKLFPKGKTNRK